MGGKMFCMDCSMVIDKDGIATHNIECPTERIAVLKAENEKLLDEIANLKRPPGPPDPPGGKPPPPRFG